ncbi:hypothetical protein CK203_098651 [Vitis vinifera]|uniref:Uncharacterized protein n=1 Tax=Vitis vinifera TaxID=29760 RepID=A0A438CM88_VITVI|nr:hypothetical protein CK203_098651 [Vitis vinifera]
MRAKLFVSWSKESQNSQHLVSFWTPRRHPLVISCELEKGSLRLKITLNGQVLGERYEPLQGAPAGHESAETPIGHESNGAVVGDRTSNQMVPLPLPLLGTNQMAPCRDRTSNQMVPLPLPLLGTNQMAPLPGMVPLYSDITFQSTCDLHHNLKRWDEPNARDMGRMTSQPKAKGEMYILNDGMNMKAEIAAMERRLEELEMNQMQEVQAISQTPLQAMPCAICLSYEHLVDECPTIPPRGKCLVIATPTIPIGGTIQISLGNHSRLSTATSSTTQASSLEQAMVNLCKVVGDFVRKQEAINAQINQRIDRWRVL